MAAASAVAPVGGAGGAAAGGGLVAVEAEAGAAAVGIEASAGKAAKAIGEVAPAAEQTGARGGRAMANFANLFGAQAGKLTGEGNLVKESLEGIDKAGFKASEGLAAAGPEVLAVVAALAALTIVSVGSVHQFEEWGVAVFRVSQLMGGGAEQASRLVYAFNLAGVSTDKVVTTLGRLSRNIQGGNLDLQRYGFEIAKNANGTVNLNETVFNLADAMERLGPGVQANTLALAALGRGGAALVPLLVQGRGALQDLMSVTPHGLLLSDEDAKRAHEFEIELRQLKIDMQAVFVVIGRELAPAFIEFVGLLDEIVRHGDGVIKFLGHMALFSVPIVGPIVDLALKVHGLGSAHSGLSSEIEKTIAALTAEQDVTDALNDAQERAEQSTKDLTEKMNAIGAAALSVVTDQRAVEASHRSRVSAERELTRAQEDLNKINKAGGIDLDKYTAALDRAHNAEEALTRARHEAIDAAQSVHEKELALAEAIDLFGANSEEARKANVELGDARFRVDQNSQSTKDAEHDLAKAHDDAAKAASGGADALRILQDAQQRVTDARQAVEDAIYGEATAAAQLATDVATAAGKTQDNEDKTINMVTALQSIADTLDPKSPVRAALQGYIDTLNTAIRAEETLKDKIAGTNDAFGDRAAGGDFAPVGTDQFNSKLGPATGKASASQTAVNIYVYGAKDPAQTASTIDQVLSGGYVPTGPGPS